MDRVKKLFALVSLLAIVLAPALAGITDCFKSPGVSISPEANYTTPGSTLLYTVKVENRDNDIYYDNCCVRHADDGGDGGECCPQINMTNPIPCHRCGTWVENNCCMVRCQGGGNAGRYKSRPCNVPVNCSDDGPGNVGDSSTCTHYCKLSQCPRPCPKDRDFGILACVGAQSPQQGGCVEPGWAVRPIEQKLNVARGKSAETFIGVTSPANATSGVHRVSAKSEGTEASASYVICVTGNYVVGISPSNASSAPERARRTK